MDLTSCTLKMPPGLASVPSNAYWQSKLEVAQNVLFCKELFAQVCRNVFKDIFYWYSAFLSQFFAKCWQTLGGFILMYYLDFTTLARKLFILGDFLCLLSHFYTKYWKCFLEDFYLYLFHFIFALSIDKLFSRWFILGFSLCLNFMSLRAKTVFWMISSWVLLMSKLYAHMCKIFSRWFLIGFALSLNFDVYICKECFLDDFYLLFFRWHICHLFQC